jgi:hypothetical protein
MLDILFGMTHIYGNIVPTKLFEDLCLKVKPHLFCNFVIHMRVEDTLDLKGQLEKF